MTLQLLDELVNALFEGEKTNYSNILRSMKLPISAFDNYCSWSAESYTRNCITENDKFELILICWEQGQITPIHNHDGQECWVRIIEGEFSETIYNANEDGLLKRFKSTISKSNDITYMVDFMGFHTLENLSKKRSISLHLYAKPIRSCKIFDENSMKFETIDLVYDTDPQLITNLK